MERSESDAAVSDRDLARAETAVATAGAQSCIDIPFASPNPGVAIQVFSCFGQQDSHQRWTFVPTAFARTYQIRSNRSSHCLEMVGNQVEQRICNASLVRQRWIPVVATDGYFQIVSELGVGDGFNGDFDFCLTTLASNMLTVSSSCQFGGRGARARWRLD